MLRFQPDTAVDARVGASVTRLLQPDYAPDLVLTDGCESEWPADRPGRLILALSHLSQLTATVNPRLELLVACLPQYLNEQGYFGTIQQGFDEQQLAGHGWLVSGLLHHSHVTHDASAEAIARRIVRNLFLPLRGQLATYPEPRHDADGAASGSIVSNAGTWLLSSDTYAIFISLEALVSAYERWRDPAISDLIKEFFDLIERDDLVAGHAQLHATMTAARCAAIFARLSHDDRGLRIALGLYNDYRTHARTLNSATINWFGRPDTWTEPCAMVDTQLLARELWRATGERSYLDDAILIETNALGYAQKPGGGFGLDFVASPECPVLHNRVYDAAWCCTMRGAVGLVDARLGSLRLTPSHGAEGENCLEIESPHQGTIILDGEAATLAMETHYPHGTGVTLAFTGNQSMSVVLHLPSWAAVRHIDRTSEGRVVTNDINIALVPGQTAVLKIRTPTRFVENRTTTGGPIAVSYYQGSTLMAIPLMQENGGGAAASVSDVFNGPRHEAETRKLNVAFQGPSTVPGYMPR
ncbi:hypothetical protein AX769_22375 (plasmid) [Frondihabitans sp. PAMC 28766]|uniref:hypothetical protein n=1 Tax=Frondihabitans sp. PAMC 28766 TaxID=1795630 RepID=UPI00078C8CEF|nr:hypothetical protein [Frondihabitans sp. PAMC 28766]AMM22874.1 hypothetical protein AX769_22375 [Frondihabitans sp. PAMC 28766]